MNNIQSIKRSLHYSSGDRNCIEILINIHRASSTYYLYTDLNVKLFLNQAKYSDIINVFEQLYLLEYLPASYINETISTNNRRD